MDALYQLAFPNIKGVGPVSGRNLLRFFGHDAGAIFAAGKQELLRIPGITEHTVRSIRDKVLLLHAEKELEFVQKHGIAPIFCTDKDYPKRLAHCPDAPLLLFYKGSAALDQPRVVSVVGTRNASAYGRQLCERLIASLKEYGVLVVSGLAYGIDSLAHSESVKQGIPTVGVLAHGLDRIYPPDNRQLATEMLRHGGLLTEYPSNTNPDKQNFPARNRIIAGLADVTIVVEAAMRGGALITAEIANSYSRDVCAFPGNVGSTYSEGCNHLVKTHRAHLISGAKDLEYLMNWSALAQPQLTNQQLALEVDLNEREEPIYAFIKQEGKVGIDRLCLHLGQSQGKLAFTLLEMEMKGLVIALPGKMYRVP